MNTNTSYLNYPLCQDDLCRKWHFANLRWFDNKCGPGAYWANALTIYLIDRLWLILSATSFQLLSPSRWRCCAEAKGHVHVFFFYPVWPQTNVFFWNPKPRLLSLRFTSLDSSRQRRIEAAENHKRNPFSAFPSRYVQLWRCADWFFARRDAQTLETALICTGWLEMQMQKKIYIYLYFSCHKKDYLKENQTSRNLTLKRCL